jgi:hypothetical protein
MKICASLPQKYLVLVSCITSGPVGYLTCSDSREYEEGRQRSESGSTFFDAKYQNFAVSQVLQLRLVAEHIDNVHFCERIWKSFPHGSRKTMAPFYDRFAQ